jgi:adenylate cyclase
VVGQHKPKKDISSSSFSKHRQSMGLTLAKKIRQWRGVVLTGSTVAGLVIVGSMGGLFQQMEWSAFDLAFQIRPQEPIDPRIVIVTINESDIRQFKSWPLSDAVLAQAIEKIEQQKPRAIGLDIYRDLPVEPGHQQLVNTFKQTSTLIGIEKALGNTVAPAPILKGENRVALADLVLDADGKVRRALLSVKLENGQTRLGLGAQLALNYLSAEGISLQPAKNDQQGALKLGKATFIPFRENDGSYVRADAGGYQILLNYRGSINKFPTIAISDLLKKPFSSELMRDRIVLIGSTAESLNDHFQTPYNRILSNHPYRMPGVVIHANIASQILSGALDGRPLLQGMSEPLDWLWISLWSFVGAALGGKLLKKNPFKQSIFSSVSLAIVALVLPGGILLGVVYFAFLNGWWLCAVTPLIALSLSTLLVQNFNNSELQRQASLDSLTLVANRRYFDEYIEQQWYRHIESKQPLSIILCDVDYFKLYNDTYGHLAGDSCLQQVAKAISHAIRSTDLVARYGGEEFIVVLPNTDAETALQVAQRISTQVNSLEIAHTSSHVSDRVTLSCGVNTIVPISASSPTSSIANADKALYSAKQKGRNCVVAADSEPLL